MIILHIFFAVTLISHIYTMNVDLIILKCDIYINVDLTVECHFYHYMLVSQGWC